MSLNFPQIPNTLFKHSETKEEGINAKEEKGFVRFVDRGDPASADFTLADLTTDDTWNDLDLSAVIPPEAKVVFIYVVVIDDAVNSRFQIRRNGNTNGQVAPGVLTQVTNQAITGTLFVSVGEDGIIEYNATNTTFTAISIIIQGWWE